MEQAKQELKSLMNELFVEDLRNKADQLLTEMATQFQGAVNDFTNEYQNLVNNAAAGIIDPKINYLNENFDKMSSAFEEKLTMVLSELSRLKTNVDDIFVALQSENSPLMAKISENLIKIADVKNALWDQEAKNGERFSTTLNLCTEISNHNQNIASTIASEAQDINSKIYESISGNLENKLSIQDGIRQSSVDISAQISELSASSMNVLEITRSGIIQEISKTKSEFDAQNNFLREELNRNTQLLTDKTDRLTKYNYILMVMVTLEILVIIFLFFK